MGVSVKKELSTNVTSKKYSEKKSTSSKNESGRIYPMMPRQYSAKERQRIRNRELQILKGIKK